MVNPEDRIGIDISVSCSEDALVVRLLGWHEGPLRKKDRIIRIDKNEIVHRDDYPLVNFAEIGVFDFLEEQRELASAAFVQAFDNGAGDAEIAELEAQVEAFDDLIKRAVSGLEDIREELAKGTNSALLIDPVDSKTFNEVRILTKSFDRWVSTRSPVHDAIVLEGHIRNIAPPCDEVGNLKAKRSALEKRTLISFAYFLDLFLQDKKCGKYIHANGAPNVDAIATAIAEMFENSPQAPETRSKLCQSSEAIKNRIEDALSLKRGCNS